MLFIAAALAGLGSLRIPDLPIDNRVQAWLRPDDPAMQRYDLMVNTFGSDESVVVSFEIQGGVDPDAVEMIADLTDAIARIDHVIEVSSLTDIEHIKADGSGYVHTGDLIPELPVTESRLRVISAEIRENPLIRRTVLSDDGTTAALRARIAVLRDEQERYAVVRQIRALAEQMLGTSPRLTGLPVIDEALSEMSARDLRLLLPTMLVLIATFLAGIIRTALAVVAAFAVFGTATVCTLALIEVTGGARSVLTDVMPLVLLVIATASSVHVLSRYQRRLSAGAPHPEALVATIADVGPPLAVASVTTAIGFASFALSPVPPLRLFGVFTGVGVLLTGALALTVLPAALSLRVPADSARARRGRPPGRWVPFVLRVIRRPRRVVLAAALLFLAGLVGLFRVEVNEHWLDYFPDRSEVRNAIEFVESKLSYSGALETLFVGDAESMADPGRLEEIDAYARYLESLAPVDRATSAADFVKLMNREFNGGNPSAYRIPANADLVHQFLLLLEGPDRDIAKFLDRDHAIARVTAQVAVGASNDFRLVEDAAKAYLARTGTAATVHHTGIMELNRELQGLLIRSQLLSLCLAMPLIVLAVIALLWNLRLLPLLLTANVLPIVATLGAMGIFSVPLNTGTVMVASISLGMVVDSSIFLIFSMQRHAQGGRSGREVSMLALRDVGPALVRTTLATASGFALLALADFRPIAQLGLLTSVCLILAFLADVLFVTSIVCLRPTLVRREYSSERR